MIRRPVAGRHVLLLSHCLPNIELVTVDENTFKSLETNVIIQSLQSWTTLKIIKVITSRDLQETLQKSLPNIKVKYDTFSLKQESSSSKQEFESSSSSISETVSMEELLLEFKMKYVEEEKDLIVIE